MIQDCILCNPAPENLIYRDDKVVVSHFPSAVKAGHVIVGIASHIRLLEDAPMEEFLAAGRALKTICETMKGILGCERFYILSVGDRDHHFHFHVIPKYESDPVFGPHAFSPAGWAGSLNTDPPVPADPNLNQKLHDFLSSTD